MIKSRKRKRSEWIQIWHNWINLIAQRNTRITGFFLSLASMRSPVSQRWHQSADLYMQVATKVTHYVMYVTISLAVLVSCTISPAHNNNNEKDMAVTQDWPWRNFVTPDHILAFGENSIPLRHVVLDRNNNFYVLLWWHSRNSNASKMSRRI